jgi:hypothetical protein
MKALVLAAALLPLTLAPASSEDATATENRNASRWAAGLGSFSSSHSESLYAGLAFNGIDRAPQKPKSNALAQNNADPRLEVRRAMQLAVGPLLQRSARFYRFADAELEIGDDASVLVGSFGYRGFELPYLFACRRWNCASSDLNAVLAGGQDFLVQPPEVEFSAWDEGGPWLYHLAGITFNGLDRAPKKPANQVTGISLNAIDRAPKKQENRTDRLALGFYRDGDFGMFWGNNGHASYDNGADTGNDAEAVAIAGISFNALD